MAKDKSTEILFHLQEAVWVIRDQEAHRDMQTNTKELTDMSDAIERLADYKRLVARLQVLSSYPIGYGMTMSRLNQDDQLQELHKRLRDLPTYMYLNKREQRLETVANAYVTRYPAGTKAQRDIIPKSGADPDDEKLLKELRQKIQKVIDARGGSYDDFDVVLERLAEFQDLREEINRIDQALKALESYKPEYARLLRLRYIEGKSPDDAAIEFNIVRQTFHRWQRKAVEEYAKLVM